MLGKERIEWEDRSWRLLENKGQVECDDWTYTGMLAGSLAAVRRGDLGWNAGWRSVMGGVGKVGVGGTLGMLGYLAWRYGVNGGKRKVESTAAL
jgi:hypothetical protein